MSTEVTRYRDKFTLCNIWSHPDTGEELYSEDKVIKALEKKPIKEWGLRYPMAKTHGLARVPSLLHKTKRRHRNVGDPAPVHIQRLLKCPAQTVGTIAKWFWFTASIYRKIKAVRTRFWDCVQYLTSTKPKSNRLYAVGKHHHWRWYSDERLRRIPDPFQKAWSKGEEMRLRYARAFWTRLIPLFEVLYTKVWPFAKLSSKTNAYQNDMRNLMNPCEIHYTSVQCFISVSIITFMQKMKSYSGIGKGFCFRRHWRVYVSSFNNRR